MELIFRLVNSSFIRLINDTIFLIWCGYTLNLNEYLAIYTSTSTLLFYGKK